MCIRDSFGTPAATSRGFNESDFDKVGNIIADALDSLLLDEEKRSTIIQEARKSVIELCSKYPIYKDAY